MSLAMPVSKVTTLGPRLDHFSVSKEDAARQAIAALRGYAYQLHQSAAAWIKLSANDQLYLEVAEDFAEVARSADQLGAILTATQVKDTRDSGSVTLNSADVRLAVQHLFALQETNPGRQVRLTFLTTSPVGVERKDPLTDGIPGITAWQLAAAGGNVAKLRSALCGRFNEGPLGKFIRTASDNEFRSRLLESLIFVCDSADWQHVEASNRAALVAMRNEVQATRDTAERAYDALLSYILRTILWASDRVLDRRQLLDCLATATSIAMPSQVVADFAARSVRLQRPSSAVVNRGKNVGQMFYRGATEIDPGCIPSLLRSRGAPQVIYFESVTKAMSELEDRDNRPEVFFQQNPNFSQLTDAQKRERRASELHTYNSEILRKGRKIELYNTRALQFLLKHLKELEVPNELAAQSLQTFAALAALLMIQVLKKGFDWLDSPRPWFESYEFNRDPSYCLFDWVPHRSVTGRRVFGYRHWVGARVGHERQYEYVMFPLKFVLPLFRDGVRGHTEGFYTWVLPQLHLVGSDYPIEQFPVGDWEAFLLQGAGGTEWWSRFQQCPWPSVVDAINLAEL